MTNTLASSKTILLAASAENRRAQASEVYRLRASIAAIQFDSVAKGRIVFLPEGAEISIMGPSPLSKCVEVVWCSKRYNIFREDLCGQRSMPVRNGPGGAMRARDIGACA